MAIGLTNCWLENKVQYILHATEEIAWAYEDKNPSGIKYFCLQVIHADKFD